jgi:hypothetical protein
VRGEASQSRQNSSCAATEAGCIGTFEKYIDEVFPFLRAAHRHLVGLETLAHAPRDPRRICVRACSIAKWDETIFGQSIAKIAYGLEEVGCSAFNGFILILAPETTTRSHDCFRQTA